MMYRSSRDSSQCRRWHHRHRDRHRGRHRCTHVHHVRIILPCVASQESLSSRAANSVGITVNVNVNRKMFNVAKIA